MLNLAWGGFANGGAQLEAVLVQAEGGIPGDLLEVNTARAWSGWRNAVHARTGVWLYLDHSDAIPPAFRNIPFQQAAYTRYQRQGSPIASPPGQSNHGWARAIDVTGFENRPDVWQAMNDLAPQFGLSNATGRASGERWHWECVNPPTTASSSGAAIIIERTDDDEMFSTEGQKFLTDTVNTATSTILSGVRREERGRLYYCETPPAGLPQFVCIFWGRAPGQANILYANAGQSQAEHWNTLYSQTADTTTQAIKAALTPAQYQTVINLALGKDSAFTNKLAS